MSLDTEFADKFGKTYRKDMAVMITILIFSIAVCAYQFYLSHFGAALILTFFAFVNSLMIIAYYTLHNKTKKLFADTNKMIDEMLDQLEKDGRL